MDLDTLFDNYSWYDKWQFSADMSAYCCRVKQLKSWDSSHTPPIMHVSILDHFQHFNFDLVRSLKVKCDGAIVLDPSYIIYC